MATKKYSDMSTAEKTATNIKAVIFLCIVLIVCAAWIGSVSDERAEKQKAVAAAEASARRAAELLPLQPQAWATLAERARAILQRSDAVTESALRNYATTTARIRQFEAFQFARDAHRDLNPLEMPEPLGAEVRAIELVRLVNDVIVLRATAFEHGMEFIDTGSLQKRADSIDRLQRMAERSAKAKALAGTPWAMPASAPR